MAPKVKVYDSRADLIAEAARRVAARSEAHPDGCIRWTGRVNESGYAAIGLSSAGQPVRFYAHRVVFEHHNGPIPDGLEVDHLCHSRSQCTGGAECAHRRCVNPAHLELVTHATNLARSWTARKPTCADGHDFTPENTAIRQGSRRCRRCEARRARDFSARRGLGAA